MKKINIKKYLEKKKPEIDREIKKYLPPKATQKWLDFTFGKPSYVFDLRAAQAAISEPIWNFLSRGGKRWRPVLFSLITEAIGGDLKKVKDLMIIPELIHNGCLTENSYLLKNPGQQVKITEIKKGDLVYTLAPNGKLDRNRVLSLKFSGLKKVYKLITRNREIEATENHPFLVITKEQPKRYQLTKRGLEKIRKLENNRTLLDWKPLRDIKPKDFIVILNKIPDEGKPLKLALFSKTPIKDKTKIPEYTNEDFCQLVGYILGNGSIYINKKKFRFQLGPSNDKEEILTYSSLFLKVFSYRLKKYKRDNRLYCYSSQVCWLLKQLGLDKKSTEKTIPEWIFTLPMKQKLAFVRGYLDSDGWVGKNRKTYFFSPNKILIEKLKLLLENLGFTPSRIFQKGIKNLWKTSKKRDLNQWSISLSNPHLILKRKAKREGNSCRFLRKFPGLPIDFSTFRLDRVIGIKPVGKKPVYDLEVENSHNFIANNLLVHNSIIVDDLEDRSEMRRGKPCLHLIFGVDVAMNAGNFLYFLPLLALIKNRKKFKPEILIRAYETYIQEMINLSFGQATDIYWHKGKAKEINEAQYLQMCAFKTGCLSRMAAKLAVVLANGSHELAEKIGKMAEAIGIAFQIQDDILNLTGEKFAKRKGGLGEDITEGKRSLMVIYTLEKANQEDKKRLLEILDLHTKNRKLINEAIEIMKKYNSIDYAKEKAKNLVKKAWREVDQLLSPSPAKNRLENFINYLVEREI